MPSLFGISSPNIIERKVTTIKMIVVAMASEYSLS